jgi:hypothetical protein
MKQQLNEVQKLQKIAGILKEDISEAPKSGKDAYFDIIKAMQSLKGASNFAKRTKLDNQAYAIKDKLNSFELIKIIKQYEIPLNNIKKGLVRTFRDDPFSDRRDVNSAIQGVKMANSIEQMGDEIEDYSGGSFNKRDLYMLVIDLIEQGTIK